MYPAKTKAHKIMLNTIYGARRRKIGRNPYAKYIGKSPFG
jgi:hypothetical protein